jgi:preprotein translocase subunit SecG
MYKYIVSSLIIVILLVVYLILLSKGVSQINEGFFSENFS